MIEIEIPPLKERPEDILPLAYYYLSQFDKQFGKIHALSVETTEIMLSYHWPGQHIDPKAPMSYPDIQNWIPSEAEKSPVFFKDMCYHPFDHVIKDTEFIKRMTNTFLIREPEKKVLSNYVMNPDVTSEEIGML